MYEPHTFRGKALENQVETAVFMAVRGTNLSVHDAQPSISCGFSDAAGRIYCVGGVEEWSWSP